MWTLTVPRSDLGARRPDLEHLGLDEQHVAVEHGSRVAESSVARLAIALPLTSETLMPSASE